MNEESTRIPQSHDPVGSIESVSPDSVKEDADDVLGIVTGGQLTLRSSLISKQIFQHVLSHVPDIPQTIHRASGDPVRWAWSTESDPSQANIFLAPILVIRHWNVFLAALILVPTSGEATTYIREGSFFIMLGSVGIDICKLILDGVGLEFGDEICVAVRTKESALRTLVIV